jgi:hypothetical protein
MNSPTPIARLRNIGPKSAGQLAAVGVETVEELERIGVVEAFYRLQTAGYKPTYNFLWSMAAGLMDMSHTTLPDEIKTMLKKQLEDHRRNVEGAQLPLEGL